MTDAAPQIPRRSYAGVMLAATAAGAAAAWFIARASAPGDGTTEATLALATVLIGSIATLAPAILSLHASNWGVCVMIAGIARGAFMLVAAFAMLKANPDAAAQAVSRGAVGGAVLILICEAAAAIRILSRLDRTIQPTRAAATGSQA